MGRFYRGCTLFKIFGKTQPLDNNFGDKALLLVLFAECRFQQSKLLWMPVLVLGTLFQKVQDVREDTALWIALLGKLNATPGFLNLKIRRGDRCMFNCGFMQSWSSMVSICFCENSIVAKEQ